MVKEQTTISVIIPTYNPGANVDLLRESLEMQIREPDEVVVVDSSSTDGSPTAWPTGKYRVYSIPKADFTHGGTRNLVARYASGDIFVFMTQDAIPADEYWLENLILPIASGEAVATYARQIPKDEADPLERFSRHFNYPPASRIQELADVQELGYKAFFFSNVCSAVRADAFWEVGAFPETVVVNEDTLLCIKLLQAGYKVKYAAEARVNHSHSYSLRQQFKRYFDLGASVAQSGSLVEGARTAGEGLRLVVGQVRYVVQTGNYASLFKVFVEAAAKLTAFNLGKQERHIPCLLKRHLSRHSLFWKC